MPAIKSPIRAGSKACCWARPIVCDTVIRWRASSGCRSIQWSTSARGTTRTWPGRTGLIERKATHSSSRHTNVPGSSPAMIREKMVAMPRDRRRR